MNKTDFKFDRVSKKIIEELQKNARISNRDLAEKVHLSPSACLKRTKKLEEQGYIRHYTLELDLSQICVNVMAMAQITLADNQGMKAAINFENEIKRIPQAVECFKISGEADYLAHFICKDVEQFNSITEELLSKDIGISKIQSNFILSTPKAFKAYPLSDLDWLDDKE